MFKFGLSSREVDILSRTLAEVQELRMEISNLREQLDRVKSTSEFEEDIVKESESGVTQVDVIVDAGRENRAVITGPVDPQNHSERPGPDPEAECGNGQEQMPEAVNSLNETQNEKKIITLIVGKPKEAQPSGETAEIPDKDRENTETGGPAGEETARQGSNNIETESPGTELVATAEPGGSQEPAGEVGEKEPPAAREEPGLNLPTAAGDWAVVNVPPRSNPWWKFWGRKTGLGKSV